MSLPSSPRRPRRRLVLKILVSLAAAVVVVTAAAVVFVNAATKDARKVSDRFVTAVQRGDGPAAYALTGPDFRGATTQAQLTTLVKGLSTLTTASHSLTAKRISVGTDTGKIAVFVYKVGARAGGSLSFKTQVRKEDGRWQVMNFRSSRSSLRADVE